MLSHIPPACRCPMMKMSGLVSSDRWSAFASSVPGLVVSASSVSDTVCLAFASSVPGKIWIASSEEDMSVKWLRLVGAWTGFGECVDVEVGVDSSVAAWRRCLKMTTMRARRCRPQTVVPRRSWQRWNICCRGGIGRAWLRLLDGRLLHRGVQGGTPCGSNGLGRPASV